MRDNPNLTPEQIDHIRSVAQFRSVHAGEVLYEPSQPDVPLFIVSSIDTLPSARRRFPMLKKRTCRALRLHFDRSAFTEPTATETWSGAAERPSLSFPKS
jgi:hypothetical protein